MKMKLPEKTLDGQNLGEAYDSYLKGNLLWGIVNWSLVQIDLLVRSIKVKFFYQCSDQ